jgi:hypothetical protein
MYDFYNQHSERLLTFTDDNQKPLNRICVAGHFPFLPFHPRDHVFWGNREDLIDLFSLPPENPDLYDRIGDPSIAEVIMKKNAEWLFYEHPQFLGGPVPLMRFEARLGLHYISKFSEDAKHMLNNPLDYVHDGAPHWAEARDLSYELTHKVFKSFPRVGVDFTWPKLGWTNYPYHQQNSQYGEVWHEEGF